MFTLVGQPNPFGTDAEALFVLVRVYLSSLFENTLPLLGQIRLMVLRNMHNLPVKLIHYFKQFLLFLTKIALESPTFAHISFGKVIMMEIRVVPLKVASNMFVLKS